MVKPKITVDWKVEDNAWIPTYSIKGEWVSKSALRKLVERMEVLIFNYRDGSTCSCEWCRAARKWKLEIEKLLESE